jgi:hypothetical protein
MQQFETQIRSIQNQFLIQKAQLTAEITNAELMVAIKQDLNAEEDLTEIQAKIDGGDTTLGEQKAAFEALRAELGPLITTLTELVTTTNATALTIGSKVANAEAALRLSAANANLA